MQHAGVHAEERQLTDERIGRDLERESGERRVVLDVARLLVLVVVRSVAFDRRALRSGDGRKSMTASSSACTPLFLNEAPQSTGTMNPPTVALRMA